MVAVPGEVYAELAEANPRFQIEHPSEDGHVVASLGLLLLASSTFSPFSGLNGLKAGSQSLFIGLSAQGAGSLSAQRDHEEKSRG